MIEQEIEYKINNDIFKGFVCFDETIKQPQPAVLISHDWVGRNEFDEDKARKLARLGYVAFALDMYGNGQNGSTVEEKYALMGPLVENRNMLKERIVGAFNALASLKQVDDSKIMAMGYCFGGLCVLDLARSGINVKGVVSFHGLLKAPEVKQCQRITSKILVLHGYDDPLVTPDFINELALEMSQEKVDWQLHAYGNTKHSFTNPDANDLASGLVYNNIAERRSWQATLNFFDEIV